MAFEASQVSFPRLLYPIILSDETVASDDLLSFYVIHYHSFFPDCYEFLQQVHTKNAQWIGQAIQTDSPKLLHTFLLYSTACPT
jgi:hypothetical protein